MLWLVIYALRSKNFFFSEMCLLYSSCVILPCSRSLSNNFIISEQHSISSFFIKAPLRYKSILLYYISVHKAIWNVKLLWRLKNLTQKILSDDNKKTLKSIDFKVSWSEWLDLNQRPLAPQASTLAKLSYTPMTSTNYSISFSKSKAKNDSLF